jgi:hypothetical protein
LAEYAARVSGKAAGDSAAAPEPDMLEPDMLEDAHASH